MLKTLRFRRFLGLAVGVLGVAALAIAADPPPPPPGACELEDAGWKTANGGCQDQITGLVWSSDGMRRTGQSVAWKTALNNCAALVEGGYGDWRLPTLAEYQQAAQHGAVLPTPHLAVNNPLYPNVYPGDWTADYKANKAYEWRFMDNAYQLLPKGSGRDWYCVRQASVTP